MSNIGGPEILVVLLVALVVLGPAKLPEAARQVGRVVSEIRRVSAGFQREFREAVHDPIIEAEARARGAVESAKKSVDGAADAMTEPFRPPTDPGAAGPTVPADPAEADPETPVSGDD